MIESQRYLTILAFCLLVIMLNIVYKYYRINNPLLQVIYQDLMMVDSKIKKCTLTEGHDSAYTRNKKEIVLCLKKDDGTYYHYNTIIYVALHEMAHCINEDSDDHDKIWDKSFQELLNKATQIGIYNPKIPMENTYCGI